MPNQNEHRSEEHRSDQEAYTEDKASFLSDPVMKTRLLYGICGLGAAVVLALINNWRRRPTSFREGIAAALFVKWDKDCLMR